MTRQDSRLEASGCRARPVFSMISRASPRVLWDSVGGQDEVEARVARSARKGARGHDLVSRTNSKLSKQWPPRPIEQENLINRVADLEFQAGRPVCRAGGGMRQWWKARRGSAA